jgi:hypothetical protein
MRNPFTFYATRFHHHIEQSRFIHIIDNRIQPYATLLHRVEFVKAFFPNACSDDRENSAAAALGGLTQKLGFVKTRS